MKERFHCRRGSTSPENTGFRAATMMCEPFHCSRGSTSPENTSFRAATTMKELFHCSRGSTSPENTGFRAATTMAEPFHCSRGRALPGNIATDFPDTVSFITVLLEVLPPSGHFGGCLGEVVLCPEVVPVVGLVNLLNILQELFERLLVAIVIEQPQEVPECCLLFQAFDQAQDDIV